MSKVGRHKDIGAIGQICNMQTNMKTGKKRVSININPEISYPKEGTRIVNDETRLKTKKLKIEKKLNKEKMVKETKAKKEVKQNEKLIQRGILESHFPNVNLQMYEKTSLSKYFKGENGYDLAIAFMKKKKN